MRAAVLALLIAGCGSDPAPAPRDAAVVDSSTPDTAFALDTAPPDAAACPDFFPGEGSACTTTAPCTFSDRGCGGTFVATCTGGKWAADGGGSCQPYCPARKPEPGTACSPADRLCTFWPVDNDNCETCTCTAGKWVCAVPESCPLEHADCKSDTACTANTGCGAGRCQPFCACGVDGVLHCAVNPC